MSLMAASVSIRARASLIVKLPSSDFLKPFSFSTFTRKTKPAAGGCKNGLKEKSKKRSCVIAAAAARSRAAEEEAMKEKLKRRTRSEKEFDMDQVIQYGDVGSHVPVMLGEVLEVFSPSPNFPGLRSFVDCTVGAAGHSVAVIQRHPELKLCVGMDVDPVAQERARTRIKALLSDEDRYTNPELKTYTVLKNFKYIKPVLAEIDEKIWSNGVDGILMDLGMSSMQVDNAERGFSVVADGPLDMRMDPQGSLKAEDILNSWPATEVGRILRDYGEESNWRSLQNKIVQARENGGLHTTTELMDIIDASTGWARGGRQGLIKTATRVFQALRIAVNDELKVLEDALYASFDCLAPGGRLAVISFHSLEDRIVKQTFLNIIKNYSKQKNNQASSEDFSSGRSDSVAKDAWVKQMIQGQYGTILTKRPITPTEEEEEVNRRSRSAKLRVIQKL